MKFIVVTSIYNPTEALREFASRSDYRLVVVGDKKTPKNWYLQLSKYLSVDEQLALDLAIPKVIPFNHYSRKMIGYLYAIMQGADAIVDTDDDNIPKGAWGFPSFNGRFDVLSGQKGFTNIYQYFTHKLIWPRGLPLELINYNYDIGEHIQADQDANIGVWQGLADEDPDVDAIYRLTNNTPTYFDEKDPVVLARGVISPFNSQNTFFRKECFPLLYLPVSVTFRFTDILRGLIAQPIMWAAGYSLGFISASVVQRRNPHKLLADFESEIPMYLQSANIVDIVQAAISSQKSICDNLAAAYHALFLKGVVNESELDSLSAWISDLRKLSIPV